MWAANEKVPLRGMWAQKNIKVGTSSLVFFQQAGSPQDDKISAAELCKVYYAVTITNKTEDTEIIYKCGLRSWSWPVEKQKLRLCVKKWPILCTLYTQAISLPAKLENAGLYVKNMSKYAADNARVNYGKHKSVYQKLKLTYTYVLPANSLAHILHNATQYAASNLNFDVKNAVLKIYCHFSFWASQLKAFCELLIYEFSETFEALQARWTDGFFGFAVNTKLKQFSP